MGKKGGDRGKREHRIYDPVRKARDSSEGPFIAGRRRGQRDVDTGRARGDDKLGRKVSGWDTNRAR